MAVLLKRALEEEGHAVDIAADGPEGLWMATENTYGAIVLDVMLPGLDGIRLCRRLREAGTWVPVLMLTARDSVSDRVRGLDAGADDYLVKPFSLLELAARLRALARRDDRSRPVVLAEGDLKLDPAAKRAWRGQTELQLHHRHRRPQLGQDPNRPRGLRLRAARPGRRTRRNPRPHRLPPSPHRTPQLVPRRHRLAETDQSATTHARPYPARPRRQQTAGRLELRLDPRHSRRAPIRASPALRGPQRAAHRAGPATHLQHRPSDMDREHL